MSLLPTNVTSMYWKSNRSTVCVPSFPPPTLSNSHFLTSLLPIPPSPPLTPSSSYSLFFLLPSSLYLHPPLISLLPLNPSSSYSLLLLLPPSTYLPPPLISLLSLPPLTSLLSLPPLTSLLSFLNSNTPSLSPYFIGSLQYYLLVGSVSAFLSSNSSKFSCSLFRGTIRISRFSRKCLCSVEFKLFYVLYVSSP